MKYGMFSEEGNARVAAIVDGSSNAEEALQKLYDLSDTDGFEEAGDTAVREAVYGHFNPGPTHTGYRMRKPGDCSICSTQTSWTVTTFDPVTKTEGRVYWCGCEPKG